MLLGLMETFKKRQPANIPGLPVYAPYLLLLSSYGGWLVAALPLPSGLEYGTQLYAISSSLPFLSVGKLA